MGKVTTYAPAVVKDLKRGLRWARKPIAELDMVDARSRRSLGRAASPLGSCRTAAKRLPTRGRSRSTCCRAERARSLPVAPAPAADSSQGDTGSGLPVSETTASLCSRSVSRRCHDTVAPIAERVSIGRDRNRWTEQQVVGLDDVRSAAVVDVQGDDHRCRLWTLIDQLVAYADLHESTLFQECRTSGATEPSSTTPTIKAWALPGAKAYRAVNWMVGSSQWSRCFR